MPNYSFTQVVRQATVDNYNSIVKYVATRKRNPWSGFFMDVYLKKLKYVFCSTDIGLQSDKNTKLCYLPVTEISPI